MPKMPPDAQPRAATSSSREMAWRLTSASVGLPLVFGVVWLSSTLFSVLVAVVATVAAIELSGIAHSWRDRPNGALAAAGAIALIVGAYFLADVSSARTSAVPAVSVLAGLAMLWLLWHSRGVSEASVWVSTLAVALYAGGFLFHAPILREVDQGREWVLFLLLVTFAADASALFVGRAFGRRLLAPSISPSKTWAGAAGGVAAALGVSAAAVPALSVDASVLLTLGLGAALGVVGQLGDLVESQLKRNAGVKDAGRAIPGHGGVLDRLDSIVFNLVVVYYFVS